MSEQKELFPEPVPDRPKPPAPIKKAKKSKDTSIYRSWGGEFPHPQLDQLKEKKCGGCGKTLAFGFHDLEPLTCNSCGRPNS